MKQDINLLKELINEGKTQYHVVEKTITTLEANGFQKLISSENWTLQKHGRYFLSPFPTMLIAFVVGNNCNSFRIAAAHTDFPMLKLKYNSQIKSNGYIQANIEAYGGLIKETWFDRPLGLAGKLVLKGDNAFKPVAKIYDSKKPLFIIPNLAPHLKKENHSIDIQKEMMPILGCTDDFRDDISQTVLLDYIASDLNIKASDILDFDLYLYNDDKYKNIGLHDTLIAAPRIDNISSVAAITEALIDKSEKSCLSIGVFYDNEEIGSRSKQGADSVLLKDIIEKINKALDIEASDFTNSFSISCDVAHGFNPNYSEVYDLTNKAILGKGFALKSSATQRYVSDSEASAIIKAICTEKNISFQHIANRSNITGGQTLGPIMSSFIPVMAADLGIPIMAMHSACELMHKDDYIALTSLLTEYYNY